MVYYVYCTLCVSDILRIGYTVRWQHHHVPEKTDQRLTGFTVQEEIFESHTLLRFHGAPVGVRGYSFASPDRQY
jgi:hypothetical protein